MATSFMQTAPPCVDDSLERRVKILGDVPAWIMTLHLAQVADVADMIAFAVLVDVFIGHLFAGDGGNAVECFEDTDRIRSPAPNVVDLSGTRLFPESLDEANHVMSVNVVANLLALVAEY